MYCKYFKEIGVRYSNRIQKILQKNFENDNLKTLKKLWKNITDINPPPLELPACKTNVTSRPYTIEDCSEF